MSSLNQSVSVSGAVVFWSISEKTCTASDLRAAIGSSFRHLIPKERPPQDALKDALTQLYANRRQIIRPASVGGGYEVVRQEAGVGATSKYSVVGKAWLGERPNASDYPTVYTHQTGGWDVVDQNEVSDAFDRVFARLSPAQITGVLTEIVLNRMQGIRLRESGGVYWIPQSAVDQYRGIGDAMPGSVQMYSATTRSDKEGVRMIADHVLKDIRESLSDIQTDFATKRPDARMVAGRKTVLDAHLSRLREYSDLFGDIFGQAEQAVGAAIVAALGCEESTPDLFKMNGVPMDFDPVDLAAFDSSPIIPSDQTGDFGADSDDSDMSGF